MKDYPTNNLLDNCISFSNEEALGIILNNLDEIFMLIDKDLRILYTTERTREIVRKNFRLEISSETSILELLDPELHTVIVELCNNAFDGDCRESISELILDGKPTILQVFFRPARNVTGEIVGCIIKANDITRQKQAENILKETEERWRFALEGGNQGVWDWDVQTGDIFFSDSYKKTLWIWS